MTRHNPAIPVHPDQLRRVHMVGIGGAGMSGVARILIDRGYTVTGSDMKDSRAILALRAAGATVCIGHQAENLTVGGELPTLVVTSFAAIPADNPELVAAREHGIPVVKRSDVLGALLEGYTSVLMAGTHGKTSTTSMAVVALQHAGCDPSFAIGGQLSTAGTNAHHGTGTIFVAEADESDASLLTYTPTVAVVTNIEADHLDFYGTEQAYHDVFDQFATRIIDGGALIVCADDPGAAALGDRIHRTNPHIRVLAYGTSDALRRHPDLPVGAEVLAITPGVESTQAQVRIEGREHVLNSYIPGSHMVLNATAAVLAGHVAGAPVDTLIEGVNDFRGVRRRFEFHGKISSGPFAGAEVYDDYAHHPTEVRAVLEAARQRVAASPDAGRVVVVFQPHLYSRTAEFQQEFADALSVADGAVILDIYGAREEPMEGVTADIISDKMTIPVQRVHRIDDVPTVVQQVAQPGDLILTMGAGTVTMLADPILAALREEA